MKKTLLISTAVIALLSCSKENIGTSTTEQKDMTFTATLQDTKTVIDGEHILWSAGDAISVWNGGTATKNLGETFTSDVTDDSATATFTGAAATALNNKYYAIYPASAIDATTGWWCAEGNSNQYSITIPLTQYAVANNFPKGCNLMYGVAGEDYSFHFSHIVGYVSFTISNESPSNIVSVKVTNIDGNGRIGGRFNVPCEGTSLSYASGGDYTITLKNEDGSAFVNGTYYIALNPRTYGKGLKFEFTTSDGDVAEKTTPTSVSLSRGQVQHVGTVKNLGFGKLPQIGDIYYENNVAKGIIAYVDASAKKYIVISATETSTIWASNDMKTVDCGIDSAGGTQGGPAYTQMIVNHVTTTLDADFPAAAFCVNYGSGWYLPSYQEWKTISTANSFKTQAGQDAFNAFLSEISGSAPLQNDTYYLTCNEVASDKTKCIGVKFTAGGTNTIAQTNCAKYASSTRRPVRAMKDVTYE